MRSELRVINVAPFNISEDAEKKDSRAPKIKKFGTTDCSQCYSQGFYDKNDE